MAQLESPAMRDQYAPMERRYEEAFERRRAAARSLLVAGRRDAEAKQRSVAEYHAAQKEFDAVRRQGAALVEQAGGGAVNDTNYIFLSFVTRYVPAGMVGLILAVIFGATMTAISGEMSALATVSVIDFYKRRIRPGGADRHYMIASRVATLFWGCYAVISAQSVKRLGSLVEVVNILGSFFYGGMLGVFVLAFYFPRVGGRGAFWGALMGEAVIFACWYFTDIAFLWYNVIGSLVVVATGVAISRAPAPSP
jgi:Na+/proline symporter